MRLLLTFAYSIFTLIKLCKQPIFQSNMNKHTEMEEVIVESSLSRLKWMEGEKMETEEDVKYWLGNSE